MGKIYLRDTDGHTVAQANYGADVNNWTLSPDGDDVRFSDYENDGYIVSLEISDARKQLEKVLNQRTVSSGGPLGLGGYGGSTRLFTQPRMLLASAPEIAEGCYTMRVKVRLEEPYRLCESSFLGFSTECNEHQATHEEEMWMQWKDGKIVLSQYPTAPNCPVEAPPPPPVEPTPPPPEGEPIADHSVWKGLVAFFRGNVVSSISRKLFS